MASPGTQQPTTPIDCLVQALAHDAARPLLTWYDDATGERVELSGTTLATWVAKTAHLLQSELGVEPGSRVSVDLPRHWTAAIWWLAIDAVGARRTRPSQPAAVAVVGPDHLSESAGAEEVVAVSMRPMGAPFATPPPALVHDFFAEARNQPDHFPFAATPGTSDRFADAENASRRAADWQLSAADRVLAMADWCGATDSADAAVPELFAALSARASVVWIRNPADASLVQRLESERVTAVLETRSGQRLAPGIRVLTP